MYEGMYSDKVVQLKKQMNSPQRDPVEEFEVIQQQELIGISLPEDNYDFLDRDLDFDAVAPEYEAMLIPDEQPLRPFFFMRLIQKSIQEGAFLTESLFIPSAVWTQEKNQIYDAEKKLELIMQLKRDMQSLGILKKNNTVHFNQVDTLV